MGPPFCSLLHNLVEQVRFIPKKKKKNPTGKQKQTNKKTNKTTGKQKQRKIYSLSLGKAIRNSADHYRAEIF